MQKLGLGTRSKVGRKMLLRKGSSTKKEYEKKKYKKTPEFKMDIRERKTTEIKKFLIKLKNFIRK